jgi:nitric oxide reductase large subunit
LWELDICKIHHYFFDGTTLLKKALSAIIRLKESEPPVLLIFCSKNAYIFEKEYQLLKTYGAVLTFLVQLESILNSAYQFGLLRNCI